MIYEKKTHEKWLFIFNKRVRGKVFPLIFHVFNSVSDIEINNELAAK